MTPHRSTGTGAEDAALVDMAAALGLAPTAQQRQQLIRYVDVLTQWNAVHNLTAVRGRAEMFLSHLADCLATIGPIQRRLAGLPLDGRRAQLLDVGSGAGLPGLVIATMLPSIDVACLDAVGKKVAFVRQAALEMQLPHVMAVHARVERHGGAYDLVTSRAFSTLDRFVASSAHLLRPMGWWMAMKAKVPEVELADLRAEAATVFHVEHLQVPGLEVERCLVWMRPT